MRAYWVHVEYDFHAPPREVFDYLAEHENLSELFGAGIQRLKDGDSERNGVGSVRSVKIGPAPAVEETITGFEPCKLIEYRVTKGGPLKNHVGILEFSELPGGGTHLDYRIRLSSNIPGLAPLLRLRLSAGLRKGFASLDRKLAG